LDISSAPYLLHAGFIFGFDPEDGGDMFLQNAVDFKRTALRYIPKYKTLHGGSLFFFSLAFYIALFSLLSVLEAKTFSSAS
jgi:hypothetical protein